MSEVAIEEFKEARARQENRNDARRIQARVREAQDNPARAAMRWPFELVQNAHDAGPRNASDLVEIKFIQTDDKLVVVHNGKPFVAQELAALLSGGSSKEFDDQETTGRFGTGFLATHALSTRVEVTGILQTKKGLEEFCIELNRGGNEDSIVDNILKADQALKAAPTIPDTSNRSTASFTYYNADAKVAEQGLDRLKRTIPYLYSTCDKLGQISVQRGQSTLCSDQSCASEEKEDDFIIKTTGVSISEDGFSQQYKTLRIGTQGSSVGLLIVLKHNEDNQHEVLLPSSDFPRLFVNFPIAGTDLPFNVLLDGHFTPRQERDGIAMNQSDRELIKEALSAFPKLIEYAVKSCWLKSHNLARMSVPSRSLADGTSGDSEEQGWWRKVVSEVASATAARPIVATHRGFFPALTCNGELGTSFLVAASTKDSRTSVHYDDLYRIANRITDLYLPVREIAEDWEKIVQNWDHIDLPVTRLGLTEFANLVRDSHNTVDELSIDGDRFGWLADYFLMIASLPEDINRQPLLRGLVPDQNSRLHNPKDVRVEKDIPDVVKDIAKEFGIDLRAKLAHKDLMKELNKPGYEPAKDLVLNLLGGNYTEEEAVDKVLETLEKGLPDGHQFSEVENMSYLRASASLIVYLLEDKDNRRLRRCPLLTAEDKIVRLENNLQILAPVSSWKEILVPYASLYSKNRIMSDQYVNDSLLKVALKPLIEKNVTLPAPLYWSQRRLEGDLLQTMVPSGTETNGLTIRDKSFGQIAFLASEVVQRCGSNKELAKRLLHFVLNVAVKEDQGWINTMLISIQREGDISQFPVHQSTWPFELKIRPWVPCVLEDNGDRPTLVPAVANEANLRELLDRSWLKDNPFAIKLLNYVFGYRQISLMLENMEDDVEDDLVLLLQEPDLVKSVAGNIDAVKILVEADPEEIHQIRTEIWKKKDQYAVRNRNKLFGNAVQEAVKEAVECLGLKLKLVDSGYDYEVFPDDSSFSFEADSYFLEVKATVSKDVRLTPKQANTACNNSNRFVLCVVDLYDIHGARSKTDWQASDVICRAKIVSCLGSHLKHIYNSITEFAEADNSVRLRNEEQLRYGVSKDLWEGGVSIAEWVESLRARID